MRVSSRLMHFKGFEFDTLSFSSDRLRTWWMLSYNIEPTEPTKKNSSECLSGSLVAYAPAVLEISGSIPGHIKCLHVCKSI